MPEFLLLASKTFFDFQVLLLNPVRSFLYDCSIIVVFVFLRNIFEPAIVLQLGPCIKIELLAKVVKEMIKGSKTVLFDDSDSEVDDTRYTSIDDEKVILFLQIAMSNPSLVKILDNFEQCVKK